MWVYHWPKDVKLKFEKDEKLKTWHDDQRSKLNFEECLFSRRRVGNSCKGQWGFGGPNLSEGKLYQIFWNFQKKNGET